MKKPPPQSLRLPTESEMNSAGETSLHIPVLLDSVVQLLAPRPGESYLDLTAGYGGHAKAIIDRTGSPQTATLVDRDPSAIAALQPFADREAEIIHAPFLAASQQLIEQEKHYDMILMDFGVSSPQLDKPERGFSLRADAPLDMRMDQVQPLTAERIINRWSEAELVGILTGYGEERPARARAISRAIISARSQQPISTTRELADIVLITHKGPWQRIHPATRTFQAIRIAVNDELGQIKRLLPLVPQLLATGGRVAFISFHSLEDRLVKRYLTEQATAGFEAELRLLTKKGIRGDIHDDHNPRARSAMLRAAVKK